MNLIERITSFFRRKKNLPSQPPDEAASLIETSEQQEISDAFQLLNEAHENAEEPLPHWLSSEDALRDEGVIFGLSNSEAEEKIAVIRTFFTHQTADIEKEVERFSEKIGELNLFIEQRENRIETLLQRTENLTNTEPTTHNLPRTVVGLLLALGICVGNYFLIDNSLTANFPENHTFIALGVLLAGLFNLFGHYSFFHEKGSSVSWRQLVEEIGMPLAASFFVFVQTIDNQLVIRSVALFGFIFFLFLFAGKLLLSHLTNLKIEWQTWRRNVHLAKEKHIKVDKWDEEIFQLKKEIDELRVQKWQILPELNKAEANLARYNSKRDSLIKLFESEFRLARSYRDKLSNKQLAGIASMPSKGVG